MGTRLSAKLEDTVGEIIKRPLVAEENHLAVDLAIQLQTASDLAHFGFADFFAADEDLTLTVGATDADTDTALTDARERGIAGGVINEIARTGATLESLRHTRGAESEADDYALQYLVAADMNPHGLADFFERMQAVLEGETEAEGDDAEAESDDTGEDTGANTDLPAEDVSEPSAEAGDGSNERWLSSVLRTHPDTRARAERARAAAGQIGWSGEPALNETEWAALQAVCSDGPIPGDTPLERVRDRIGDVLKPGENGEDAGE